MLLIKLNQHRGKVVFTESSNEMCCTKVIFDEPSYTLQKHLKIEWSIADPYFGYNGNIGNDFFIPNNIPVTIV